MSGTSSSSRTAMTPFPTDENIVIDLVFQSVNETFTLKKSVNIKTVSGSVNVKIVPSPIPSHCLVREINTQSSSGSQQLELTNSLGPFLLNVTHITDSGSIKSTLPIDWCGTIELSIVTSSYKIKSDIGDVRVVSDIADPKSGTRRVLALKGNPTGMYSTLRIESSTGSVAVRFEKRPALRDMTEAEAIQEAKEKSRLEGDKEKREIDRAPVTRASVATTSASTTTPGELPPPYDVSERDNVMGQVSGTR